MVNDLLRPTNGQVLVDGISTIDWDPIRLRRHIGYVIQDVGLFPHFTIADNVGLVPRLEGWTPQPSASVPLLYSRKSAFLLTVRRALSPGAVRRATPAGGCGPRPGRRPAALAV